MAGGLWLDALAFRVALYFGRNPDEQLSTADIAVKFGVDADNVRSQLRRAVECEVIAKRSVGPGHPAEYSAGPKLLTMIGTRSEACMPVGG
jgi:hypothetical protein